MKCKHRLWQEKLSNVESLALFKLSFAIPSTTAKFGIPKSSCPVRYDDAKMHATMSLLLLDISSKFPGCIYITPSPCLDVYKKARKQELITFYSWAGQICGINENPHNFMAGPMCIHPIRHTIKIVFRI